MDDLKLGLVTLEAAAVQVAKSKLTVGLLADFDPPPPIIQPQDVRLM